MSAISARLAGPTSIAPTLESWLRRPAEAANLVGGVLAEDRRLVEAVLANRASAVRQLVERFQADIYGLCVRLLGDRHEAEDVAQEVFLRVFRSLSSWDRQRPLRPWLVGITINRCRTFLAKRARRPKVCENLNQQEAKPLHGGTEELQLEIRRALDSVRPEYQEVFVLFHEQGWAYEDIAAAMDRPVGTIKTWLHRVRLEVLERLRARGMVEALADDV